MSVTLGGQRTTIIIRKRQEGHEDRINQSTQQHVPVLVILASMILIFISTISAMWERNTKTQCVLSATECERRNNTTKEASENGSQKSREPDLEVVIYRKREREDLPHKSKNRMRWIVTRYLLLWSSQILAFQLDREANAFLSATRADSDSLAENSTHGFKAAVTRASHLATSISSLAACSRARWKSLSMSLRVGGPLEFATERSNEKEETNETSGQKDK